MYVRFFRWAADRLDENGVLAFVSNRSFIESQAFDGFRKVAANEFSEIWLVDLGGNVRENPKLSGTKHNVFGIQTGVAISFMVKRARHKGCRVFYVRRPELETEEEKLSWTVERCNNRILVEILPNTCLQISIKFAVPLDCRKGRTRLLGSSCFITRNKETHPCFERLWREVINPVVSLTLQPWRKEFEDRPLATFGRGSLGSLVY